MTVIRCVDFETTGFPPKAGVCEAGWTDVTVDGTTITVGETFSRLCNPNMPIEAKAQEVHGISDAMVSDKPPSATIFKEMAAGADIFCAHNSEFEQNFFGGGDKPWICTYKVALKLWPNLPNHKNGTIPEHLAIELDLDRCAPLHRAGPDTYVTAMILNHMLRSGVSVSEMVAISTRPREISRMPFGKHKGSPLSELPLSYIRWAVENMDAKDVREAIRRELERRAAA